MAQPGKGGHGAAPTAAPITMRNASKSSSGAVHCGVQPGGTRGTK